MTRAMVIAKGEETERFTKAAIVDAMWKCIERLRPSYVIEGVYKPKGISIACAIVCDVADPIEFNQIASELAQVKGLTEVDVVMLTPAANAA